MRMSMDSRSRSFFNGDRYTTHGRQVNSRPMKSFIFCEHSKQIGDPKPRNMNMNMDSRSRSFLSEHSWCCHHKHNFRPHPTSAVHKTHHTPQYTHHTPTITLHTPQMIASAAAFAEERLSKISAVKTNDREFDDWNVYGWIQDNAAELHTQVAIADGLFFGGIFWMTSASLTAIIWKGREILQRKDGWRYQRWRGMIDSLMIRMSR